MLKYELNKRNLISPESSTVHAVINIMICLKLPVKNISVLSVRYTQRVRVHAYNDNNEQFVLDAAEFYNTQVSEEIMEKEIHSQPNL